MVTAADSYRLVVTGTDREDIGEVPFISLDVAFGSDENNFKLSAYADDFTTGKGALVYVDGTEYGGIIDAVEVTLDSSERRIVSYSGRTWQGILANQIITPDAGRDYYSVSGEANGVLGEVIARQGIGDIMAADTSDSGVAITGYTFERFTDAYTGLRKMLAAADALLACSYDHVARRCVLAAVPRAQIDEQSIDELSITMRSTRSPNHVIVGGAGDLGQRVVVHRYADDQGNVSATQTITGAAEVVHFYDYTTANQAEAEEVAESWLKDAQSADAIEVAVTDDELDFRVGDVVPVSDAQTGTEASGAIAKKILRINADGSVSKTYETVNETGRARYGEGALWPPLYVGADGWLYYVTGALGQDTGLPAAMYSRGYVVYDDGVEDETGGAAATPLYRGYDRALYYNG